MLVFVTNIIATMMRYTMARFMERSAGVRELSRKAARLCELTDGEVRALAEELRRGLDDLKG